MKIIFKKLIVTIITWESRMILAKYKPKIIAVTGNVGKTSTKDAIYTVLSTSMFVRKSDKSFNSDTGVPLTILGCPNGWTNPFAWLSNIIHGLELIVVTRPYPKVLILEVGADRPGDIKNIAAWLKPDTVVLTRFSQVPVHVEFFESRAELIKEKGYLVEALKPGGTLVLNFDDADVMNFKARSKGKWVTYGFQPGADILGSHETIQTKEKKGVELPTGVGFRIDWNGNSMPVVLNGVLGLQHLYPVLAAVAVGSTENLNMVTITQALLNHIPPRGRMNVLEGVNTCTVIDDTYNSSPVAVHEALDTLKKMTIKGRKIAVLGDMLELGKYSIDAHKKAGEHAAQIVDLLIVVGLRALYIKEGALEKGLASRKMFVFENSNIAASEIAAKIKKGDVVLVKGSQSMRMERIVEKLLAEPTKKGELLVRQEEEWLRR
ncbi:MAG TPA: UDP-N-acetylmuramoyl-tripeptide--D-alanyl-D-alanine ligase [Candidatus Paceibacterota bacterium]